MFIETPKSLHLLSVTWSDYKHHNTVKYLVSVHPSGHFNFVSKGWGGCVSDKYLTAHSDFYNLVEPGDYVMADKGFTI